MKTLLQLLALITFLFCHTALPAQKEDFIWLQGYRSDIGYDSATAIHWGETIFDFNQNPVQVSYDSLQMNFQQTNTSYCDSAGNLLFYTNGIFIANKWHEKIENSDSLNGGYIPYQLYPFAQTYGYFNPQGVIALHIPGTESEYALLHSWEDTFQNNLICKKLLYTHLDMSLNSGHGKVLSKNQVVVNHYMGSEVVATKHANGRDWWLLSQKRGTNCFTRTLVDSSGPHVVPGVTCGGPVVPYEDDGAAQFSPDGTKFAYFQIFAGLTVFDFNRCTGELSNPQNFLMPTIGDSGWYPIGVAFSPNSNLLYASASFHLYQFDLNNTNIFSEIDTVAIIPKEEANGDYFCTAQLAPDGKIYLSSSTETFHYTVIDYPDLKGNACLVHRAGIPLSSISKCVPNYPNYRLVPLPDSLCFKVSAVEEITDIALWLFPNPATDNIQLQYSNINWKKGPVSLEIQNSIGQVVLSQQLPFYSAVQSINLGFLPKGVYLLVLKQQGRHIANTRFVKE